MYPNLTPILRSNSIEMLPDKPVLDHRLQMLCSKKIQDKLEEITVTTNSIPLPEEVETISIQDEKLSAFVYLDKGHQCMHQNRSEKISQSSWG